MKSKTLVRLIVLTCLCVGLSKISFAETAEFVGAKKCSMCHKSDAQGRQYPIWQESGHAHAYETLLTPAAKEIAKTWNITEPEKSGRCLKCHSTAYNFTESLVSQTLKVEEGVSCESCHGAGSLFAKKSIMEDAKASAEAGLQTPDEKTCRQCHGSGGPTPENFDFASSWEKIKHPIPAKE